ncbi:hypothetical protein PG984_015262 [Apiospora sp. TS-2023a]
MRHSYTAMQSCNYFELCFVDSCCSVASVSPLLIPEPCIASQHGQSAPIFSPSSITPRRPVRHALGGAGITEQHVPGQAGPLDEIVVDALGEDLFGRGPQLVVADLLGHVGPADAALARLGPFVVGADGPGRVGQRDGAVPEGLEQALAGVGLGDGVGVGACDRVAAAALV